MKATRVNTRSGDWCTPALILALACTSPALHADIVENAPPGRVLSLAAVTDADSFRALHGRHAEVSFDAVPLEQGEARALVSIPKPVVHAQTLRTLSLVPDFSLGRISLRTRTESSEPELPVPIPAPLALLASALAAMAGRLRG